MQAVQARLPEIKMAEYFVECDTCQTQHRRKTPLELYKAVWVCVDCTNDICDFCKDMDDYHEHEEGTTAKGDE